MVVCIGAKVLQIFGRGNDTDMLAKRSILASRLTFLDGDRTTDGRLNRTFFATHPTFRVR
jgi:hypothetical protein